MKRGLLFCLLLFPLLAGAQGGYMSGKIPIDSSRWYQMNNAFGSLGPLFNGVTNEVVSAGYGQVLPNWDAYYPLLEGEDMTIDSIKLFDGQGSNPGQPFTLSIINAQWQRIPVATFTGDTYMTWRGPYPDRPDTAANIFKLDSVITGARYLVINTYWAYPTELELYGTYHAPVQVFTPYTHAPVTIGEQMGFNGFEWYFEDGNTPQDINESKMAIAKAFTGYRHYMDWEKLEPTEGGFTYNPCHSGGWSYDTMYSRCKDAGIEVLACLKTMPDWMLATYPTGQQDGEDVPVRYGSDFSDPASYIDQARVAFQYVARYGSNAQVPDSLMRIDSTQRWTGDPKNVIKKGLNLVHYIECDNERDKWWKGRAGYQTGREYAANLSAFYDGNMNTMGAGIGVKNADPAMQVVMAGTASPVTDYFRGMIDWCREHRGYNADSTVNLCWDVINYHLYADNSNSLQSGTTSGRGAAPEVSVAPTVAATFLQAAHDWAYDMPVWITETGYDLNQGSPYHCIAIGNKTVQQTQGDWLLRTSLLDARLGIGRTFFYELYDDNPTNPIQFGSSGLANDDQTRRPAADYMLQTNKLVGNYSWQATLSAVPVVDKYTNGGQAAYAVWMPTETDSTVPYQLTLGTDSAFIYTPTAGQDTMAMSHVATPGGVLAMTARETPVFVVPGTPMQAAAVPAVADAMGAVRVFPNPAVGSATVYIANGCNGTVSATLTDVQGRIVGSYVWEKPGAVLTQHINLSGLGAGVYLLHVAQAGVFVDRKVVKE